MKNTQKNLARLGCAIPKEKGQYDLYFLQKAAELEPQSLARVIEAYIPALLGALELCALECGEIDPKRGDNAAAIQTTTTAALDLLLRQQGKQGADQRVQSQFQNFAENQTGSDAIHKIHHIEDKNADQWRKELRPTVTSLGGLGEIEVQTKSAAALELLESRGGLTWLPSEWKVDRSSGNLLVVKGFEDKVRPRLAAVGATKEEIAQRILDITAEKSSEPIRNQLGRVAGIASKISFPGLPWNKAR